MEAEVIAVEAAGTAGGADAENGEEEQDADGAGDADAAQNAALNLADLILAGDAGIEQAVGAREGDIAAAGSRRAG